MVKNNYEVIIVGAGISGIGCASKLLENKYKNFKIISPDIGGRIIESESNTVEYGAYYVMDLYHNTQALVKKGRKLKASKLNFHKYNHSYKVLSKKLFTHTFQFIKLILILKKFKKHYEKFKKKTLYHSQINSLMEDEYLWSLYNTNARDFVLKKGVKNVVYDFIAEVLHGTAFTPIDELNAFTFLHFSLPLITPIPEFIFRKKEIKKILSKNLIKDEVVKIIKRKNNYELITKSKKKFSCDKIIIATPPHISKKLLGLKDPLRKPAKAHMFHMVGEIKSSWAGEENLFSDENRMFAIAHQADNSYLFYSKSKTPDFEKYFYNYKILKYKFWNPAFNIGGSNILQFKQKEQIYLIGDNNICGLEDAYIYGQYAANYILGKNKD